MNTPPYPNPAAPAATPTHAYDAKAPVYFDNVRREIEPLLPAHATRVLEIGCGAGATLGWLKEAGRVGHATGIELAAAAADRAQALGRVDVLHRGDAEALIDADVLPPASFDLVLCLDVLEHLVDPWALVRKLPRVMAPGALLVASIPNVRHLEVLVPLLLKGRFDYAEHGVLDRTHLRFFTRASALALIAQGGFAIERCERRMHPWPSRTGWLNLATLGLAKDLLAINYLIAARRP